MVVPNEKSKTIIAGIFISCVIAANVVAGKVLQLGPFTITSGVLFYGFTFLGTDLMSELYGKKASNDLVMAGFIASVLVAVMFFVIQFLPSAPFAMEAHEAYNGLLGTNFRYVAASMVAYLLSQHWDVWLFHLLGKKTRGKHKWLRNNAGTMTSQIIDTVVFTIIAFGFSVPNLVWMMLSQYLIKFIIAACDTPIFYLLTKGYVQKEYLPDDTKAE